MQKNYFDLNLFRFSKYLNDIGILSRLNTERFQKYFHEISSNFYNLENISSSEVNMNIISIKKCLISALITYIQSLSEEDQKILALNIFEKYDKNEIKLEGKLIKLIDIYSKYKLKKCFNKWKSEIFILTNSLKKVISSNILSSIQNSFQPKIFQNYKEINTTKENSINNNTMFNINHHLNISTNPDIFNNYNNYSFHDINIENNINYTYENKNKRKNNSDSNRTYSSNYFNPDQNYINNNYHNDSYNYILNYLNKTNKKNSNKIPLSKERYSTNNSAILNNNHISTHKSKKSKVNLEYINNLSKSKTEHNLIPEKTSQYLKEQNELINYCTFKPKINKSSSLSHYYNSSNKRTIDRLYLDSKSRLARKELESLKKNTLESKENTFQPKFVSSSVKRVKSDFDKRLKEFEINKKNKIKKLSEDLEEEQKQQFTFIPKINEFNYNNNINNRRNINNSNNYTISNLSKTSTINQSMISKNNNKRIPVYKRLYNENKNKLIRQEKREKEEMEKIKKNSSKISEGSIGFNNNILDKKKTIEELYNDYKSKKARLKLKQEEIEKEQGITFQPELISDKNYFNRIIPDFYQREKIFLEKQQKNIEIYKQYLENEQNNNKKYSQEEKKEIFNNIVTRLYKDGMEKYKEKQGKINYKNDSNDINENYEFKI